MTGNSAIEWPRKSSSCRKEIWDCSGNGKADKSRSRERSVHILYRTQHIIDRVDGAALKILMMVSRLNVGGTEQHILSISRELAGRGVRVEIATEGGPLAGAFRMAGIPLHILLRAARIKQESMLSSLLAKGNYRLIHAHDSGSFELAASLSRQHQIPFVATVHGTYYRMAALSAAIRASRRIITVSDRLTRWLSRYPAAANKIRMIPNGIDLNTFRPSLNMRDSRTELKLPQNAQLMVYAGRFSNDKYAIARSVALAAGRIAKANPRLTALLVGPGSNRASLILLASRINRELGRTAVIVRPPMMRIQRAYHAADLVVGTGRVALEAMSCAKPVIAIGVAGYCGIVKPGNTERIIQSHFGDHGSFAGISIERLASDLSSLLGNPQQARLWGEKGAQIVRSRFSVFSVCSRLLQVYRETI